MHSRVSSRVVKSSLAAALVALGLAGVSRTIAQTTPTDNVSRLPSYSGLITAPTVPGMIPFQGATIPSNKSKLSLRTPGVIYEINVKPGDKVKKGDVLLSEDTREEKYNLQIIKREADSNVTVDIAKKKFEEAKVTFERYKKSREPGAKQVFSDYEYDKARVEMEVAELDIEAKQIELDQKRLQMKRQEQVIENMQIKAPYDGIVKDLNMKLGEVVDPQKEAIVLVQNEPLWVKVALPSRISMQLQMGQEMELMYEGSESREKARIIYFDPEIDVSNTQLIRLELANPKGIAAGLPVFLLVPDKLAQASASR